MKAKKILCQSAAMIALAGAVIYSGCRKDVDQASTEALAQQTTSTDSASGTISTLAARSSLTLESTFDATSYLSGWTKHASSASYAIQQSNEQVRSGSALRLEVRSSDASVGGSIRSQITRPNDPMDQDVWYGFSVYLKDWTSDVAGENIFEWQPTVNSGSSTLSLWTSGGKFTVVSNNNGSTNQYAEIGSALSNQWVDFVIRTKWSTSNTGVLQIWMNGTQVVNRSNVKTAAGPTYLKLGINKWGWGWQTSSVTKRLLYFDDVRIGGSGATYEDVKPGGTSTPPPTTPPPANNQAPVVSIGAAQTITLPTSTTTLTGSATDADGTIASYLWTKVSGPSGGAIVSPTSGTTVVNTLVAGSYVYNLKATDNKGATASKTITITVNPSVVVPPPTTPPTGLLLSSNFSSGFAGFTTYQIGRGTNASSPTNSANKTFRAEVRAGDAAISSGYRSELVPSSMSDNGDMWYGYNVYHQTLGQGGGGHSMQWHPGNSTGSATLGLYTDYGKFNVVRSINGGNYYQGGQKVVQLNKWYSLVWHVKWSTGSDGLIELWIDGEKYFTYSGKTMESYGVYFKFGMNRWAFNNDWVIFYDNLKVAKNSNYNSVVTPVTGL